MPPAVLADMIARLPDAGGLAVLATAILLAGVVRGFSGFGAAMIFMPAAATVIDPASAAAGFLLLDTLVTLPLLAGAVRRCDWSTVLPASLAAMALVPVGAAILASADTLALRWALSAIVLVAVTVLILGWRYRKAPGRLVSVAVGATAGFLSGVSQVSAPPVAVFWAAGPQPPMVIRANLIAFFAIVSLAAFTAFVYNGFYTLGVVALVIALAPIYAAAVFLGARGFGRSRPEVYRPIAYVVILLSALSSLPLLDPLLRGS